MIESFEAQRCTNTDPHDPTFTADKNKDLRHTTERLPVLYKPSDPDSGYKIQISGAVLIHSYHMDKNKDLRHSQKVYPYFIDHVFL